MGDPMSQRGPLKGKIVNLRVKFLDDNVHAFQISIKALGNALWEAVVRHLQLVESDYFDLQYDDTRGLRCWLDHEKGLLKQLPSPDSPLDFCVKFYTPDPGLLDEFTRYLYALQIKKDLGTGHMVCSENTAALLASYIVQAEFGDFIIEEYTDHSYLMSIPPFIPRQSDSLLRKVMEYHKQHIGETPAEAEASLVDVARKVETYGIRLNAAKDHEGVALYLAVAHLGILVFQNNTKINTFSWAKIRKLSFKRKKFLIKLHPETYPAKTKGYYKDTVEFFYESRDESKNFWKQCIEHHAFFRCHMIKKIPRNKTKLVSRGSSFRYSGRTQKQLMTYVRETCVKSPSFQRSVSGRISSASRSTSVTPKIPAKMTMNNSTDTHNSTASSGSHILSTGADTPHDRTEVVDVHSAGSSLSGSRSLGSPKPDHSSTPDGTIDTKAYLVGGGEEPVPSLYERGAHSNLVITNAIVTHNQNMSTNQNPTDNDQSDLLLTGGGRQLSADKDMYTINEVENRLDKINSELSRQNIENVPDSYREKLYSSLGKESKKVVFAAEVGKAGESSNESNGNLEQEEVQGQSKVLSSTEPEHDLQAETQREIEDLIASVQEEKRKLAEGERSEVNNEKSFIIQLKDEVPAGSCITVSVGVSSSRQNSPDKHFAPDIASQNSMDSIDLDHTGHTSTECDSYSFSSLANSEDLFDTIPYILHRRHFSEDADEENDIVSPVEPSIQFHSLRRSRSLKKKRPTNIQVEQVKVYAGSEDGSPSPQLHQRSFSCGTKRSHQSRSPSEKGIQILNSRSPSGKRTPNTPSSHEQSPAGGGRRNYFTLPPRDSFSSIDDTASPDFEKDIIKYIKDHHLDDLCDIVSGSEMKLGLNEIEPESYLFSKPVVESKELKNSENNFETADAECNSYSDKSINNNQSNNGVKNKAEKKSKNGQNGKSKSGTNNGVERKNKQKQSDNEKSNSEQLQSKAKNKKKLKNGNGAKKIETVDLIEKHPISSDDGSLDFPSPAAVFLLTEDLPPPYPGIVSKPPHALRPEDRKLSAPVFGTKEYQSARDRQNDNRLSRCDEIENIPTSIQEEPSMSDFHISVNRTVSETDNSHLEDREDSPPPPPPPPPLEDDIPFTPPNYRSTPQRDYDHGTSILSEHEGPRSNVSVLSSSRTEDSEDDHKKKAKRHLVDRAYYIAKELLMTERTYKKDLEVITVFFRNAASNEDNVPECLVTLFSYLVPMYEFHCEFLKELDQRLSMWYVYPPSKFNIPDEKEHSCIREGKTNAHMNGDYQRIGDILNNNFNFPVLNMYKNYIDHVENLLAAVQETMKKDKMFDHMYKEFESQKVCYLPLNTFFLKPGQRLLHYRLILERITKHYSLDHHDYPDCDASLKKISDVVSECKEKMRLEENLQKLIELQRDMIGIESIVHPDRKFVREGCLQKFSRKGYQQRMFFLFSDILLYSSRTASSLLQFKVHGQLPLRGMIVEESDHAKMAVANSFAIYGGNKCILVAASSQEEKDKWIEDLNEAIIAAKNRNDDKLKYASLKSSTSSSENVDNGDTHEMNGHIPEKQIQHRANTTMHVCWHRNTSVSLRDHDKSVKNQMSGYLLRKFKNSNGWQKLWVVFTNFCLFFYKTYQDDFPLASLPLLGYAVNTPDDEDGIHKDHVFKLQFKNHVYFFRAESEYTFERWMEVINSATNSARRIRLFSRLDSQQAS